MKSSTSQLGPVRLFKTQADLDAWLETNHRQQSEIWLRIAKKDSGLRSVSYAEALETALCYGWTDGQKRPENEQTWLQRFVPRSGKHLVEDQPRKSGGIDRKWPHAGGGTGSSRASERRWMLGHRLRFAQPSNDSRGFPNRAEFQSKGEVIFRGTGQCQSLCNSVSHSNRKETGDPCQEGPGIYRNAGKGRDDSSSKTKI